MNRALDLIMSPQTVGVLSPYRAPVTSLIVPPTPLVQAPDFAGLTRHEWYADSLQGTLNDLDVVPVWTDLAQGLALSQALTPAQPQFVLNDLGYPAVLFDGADDQLNGDSSSIDTQSGLTVFMVSRLLSYTKFGGYVTFRTADTGANNTVFTIYTNATAGSNLVAIANRATSLSFYQGQSGYGVGIESLHTIELNDTLNTITSRGLTVNGTLTDGQPSNTTNSIQPANLHSIIRMGVGYDNVPGHVSIKTLLCYSGGLMSAAQVDQVRNFLNARYGGIY